MAEHDAHAERAELDRLHESLSIALHALRNLAAVDVHAGQNNLAMQALAAIDELAPEPDGPSPEGPPWAAYGLPDAHGMRTCVCGRAQPECVCAPPFNLGDRVVTWWGERWTQPMVVADMKLDRNWLTLVGIGDDGSKITTHPWLCRPQHKSAAEQALDEIAKLCGCPYWQYPGQVVRDVQTLVTRQQLSERPRPKREHETITRVYTKEPRDWWRCVDCDSEGDAQEMLRSECSKGGS